MNDGIMSKAMLQDEVENNGEFIIHEGNYDIYYYNNKVWASNQNVSGDICLDYPEFWNTDNAVKEIRKRKYNGN